MNKDYLNSLSKDQLENRIYDLNNELNQEWHLERIMKYATLLKCSDFADEINHGMTTEYFKYMES